MPEKRSRTFSFVLWADSENFETQFQAVKENPTAYILHDKDFDENGEIKKAHYHVFYKSKDGQTLSAVAKQFKLFTMDGKVNEGAVTVLAPKTKHTVVGCCRYMIHIDNPDKYQYSKASIKGNLAEFCKTQIKVKTNQITEEEISALYDYICNTAQIQSLLNFTDYSKSVGMLSYVMRTLNQWRYVIDAHNNVVKKMYADENIYTTEMYKKSQEWEKMSKRLKKDQLAFDGNYYNKEQ